MKPKFGISLDGFLSLRESVEVAGMAVSVGAESLWMCEHLGYRETITSCMAFAMRYPDVKIVPTSLSPYLHHPVPTATALATLSEASPGNIALAIGVGNPMFLAESGIRIDRPVRAMREYTEALRALWTAEPVDRADMLYTLKGARIAFRPAAPVPLYLAPMKAQMLRLCGRIADGVVTSVALSAGVVERSLGIVEAGRAESARTSEPFVKAGFVYLFASHAPKAARETLRRRLAFSFRNRHADENLAHSGLPIDQEAIMAAISRRDLDQAMRLVPEEAIDAFTITGTPAQCRDSIESFRKAGLDEIVFMMVGDPADWAANYEVIRDVAR
jgi:5,10-methylenetetrahydromethanopterin reductase